MSNDEKWVKTCEEYKLFVMKTDAHIHPKSSSKDADERRLARWAARQRAEYKAQNA